MDRKTASAYDRDTDRWIASRTPKPRALRRLARMAAALGPGARVADLGCGPGWYAASLRRRGLAPVALDASAAMLRALRRRASQVPSIRADLAALPFARGSLDGAVAFNAYQHLPPDRLPAALAQLHAAVRVGAPIDLTIGDLDAIEPTPSELRRGVATRRWPDDALPGRLFSLYGRERIGTLLRGAGFTDVRIDRRPNRRFWLWIRATRGYTLPDYVRPGLALLFCGLNPSLLAAETGVPYGRPGNRFWPAVLRAGLCPRDRDPGGALERGVGFTDLVKRPTRSAGEVSSDEYASGLARVEECVRFFRPRVVCFVGLDGWRRAVDRRATPGWIARGFGGRPAYLMPSTSGLNAHVTPAGFVRHLRAAARNPGAGGV